MAAKPLVPGTMSNRLRSGWYRALSKPALSDLTCRLSDIPLPQPAMRALITAYCAAFDVNMREAEVPDGGFRTFNAFFTRALIEGARPITQLTGAVASPADARLAAAGTIGRDLRLEAIKGRDYSLSALLGDNSWAKTMVGGYYATLYLSPRDYHRVHSPTQGVVASTRSIDGARFPVMPAAIEHIDGLLARNARTVVRLTSEHFGDVAVVLVGATNVSRISLALRKGEAISSGDEVGAFNLGSTVVLAVQKGVTGLAPTARLGEMVKMGQALFTS